MFRSSLDTIRKLLKDIFPTVNKTYVEEVPAGFVRPSFFIKLITSNGEALTNSINQFRATWQIIYFAQIDASGNHDAFNQLDVSDTLSEILIEGLSLNSPDGDIFTILESSIESNESEIYITLRLETEKTKAKVANDLMEDIQHKYNLN